MASGDTLVCWRALDAELPDGDFAVFDTLTAVATGANDPVWPYLMYDDAVNRYAYFGSVMPAHYSGGGVNVQVVWMSPATSGNCVWIVSFKRMEDGVQRLDNLFFGNETFIIAPTDAVAHVIDYSTIAVSDGADLNLIEAGEYFWMEMFRDGDSGNDTLTNEARLLSIIISEQ